MKIKKIPYHFSVCKVSNYEQVDLSKEYCFIGKTEEENSLVCISEDVPEHTIQREDGWKAFRVEGVLEFSMVGILANIATLLANYQIPIFVISTFQTDYLLVKQAYEAKALELLQQDGWTILE